MADNDQEIWFLTKAGEFIRVTGDGSPRFYVVDRDAAPWWMEDLADAEQLAILGNLGMYEKTSDRTLL